MQRALSSSGYAGPACGRQHVSDGPAAPVSTSRERVRSLAILIERQDGWHLDWVDVVDIGTRRARRLTAHAQNGLAEDGQ